MKVHCQGCAGCCLDWRPLLAASTTVAGVDGDSSDARGNDPGDDDASTASPGGTDAVPSADQGPTTAARRTRRMAIDDVYNLVPLTRDDVRTFLEAGLGDVLVPRLWEADADDDAITIDGYEIAAIAGRPVFFVGLRKVPKPVAPFGRSARTWLPACVFLDPGTLQCRVHDEDCYPEECEAYPGHNVALEAETECDRVEGTRIRRDDDAPPGPGPAIEVDTDPDGSLLLGPQAVGQKVFVHPDPDDLEGRLEGLAADALSAEDRAAFVAVAAASAPGTLSISEPHRERAHQQVLEAASWAGGAADEWTQRAPPGTEWGDPLESLDSATLAREVERERGAPETPGWE